MALNGVFRCDDGARYRIVETEDRVSWTGLRADGRFANVFNGRRTAPGEIQGFWYDLPSGGSQGYGELSLQVDASDQVLNQISSTGGFGGTRWIPIASPVVIAPPVPRTHRSSRPARCFSGECAQSQSY